MTKFSDFVETNPKIQLDKGEEYEFVEMADVTPNKRYVYSQRKRKLEGGGSKFQSGDVLFARITPCLEHGKIVQFKSVSDKPAFGSTEFFVFRKIDGVSDQGYIFYLSLTDTIRKPAEKSMVGASGRQRASLEAIRNIEFDVPILINQKKIVSILSNYDDLIENNAKRIHLLEKIAKLIYDEWFVKFKFPGHEKVKFVDSELGKIPEGWNVKNLGLVCSFVMGQSPKSKFYNTKGKGLPFHQGVTNYGVRYPIHKVYCTVEKRIANEGDILISVRAPVGRLNIADRKLVVGRGLAAIRHNQGLQSFLFYQLKNLFSVEDTMGSGTIFNAITKDNMYKIKLPIPNNELDLKFNELVKCIDQNIRNSIFKNKNFITTRDLLLPKLISGSIDVSDLDIQVPEVET